MSPFLCEFGCGDETNRWLLPISDSEHVAFGVCAARILFNKIDFLLKSPVASEFDGGIEPIIVQLFSCGKQDFVDSKPSFTVIGFGSLAGSTAYADVAFLKFKGGPMQWVMYFTLELVCSHLSVLIYLISAVGNMKSWLQSRGVQASQFQNLLLSYFSILLLLIVYMAKLLKQTTSIYCALSPKLKPNAVNWLWAYPHKLVCEGLIFYLDSEGCECIHKIVIQVQRQAINSQLINQSMQYPPNQVYPLQGYNQQGNPNNAQFNQGFSPQPPINMNQMQQVDLSLAGGFGDMFFNMNDPRIAQTNVPVKQDSSTHTATIIASILMIAGIVVGGIGFRKFLLDYATALVIVIPYLIYVLLVIFASDIRGYITNLKKFDEYKETYDGMVAGKGFFIFWIQCYHYRTVRTKNGTRREKVVTHTATQRFNPTLSQDVSGNITGIQDITKYVFINYLKKFYFADANSERNFNNAYSSFISRNRRDQHQNYTQTFDIEGFQEEVGFCALGEGSHNAVVFYITAFLGFALIYSCILERSVSRYSINIVKKLTC